MIDHFSFFAPYYDRLIGSSDTNQLKDILGLPTDGWLLDAGGGTGRISSQFRNSAQGIIVCDISRPMLRQSIDKNSVIPVNSTVDNLPFADNTIDRILVVDALHHFQNASIAVHEFVRVLKPGGKLVIEEFDINTLFVKCLALAEKLLLMGSHFYKPEEIARMTKSPGLTTNIVRNGKHSYWVVIEKPV